MSIAIVVLKATEARLAALAHRKDKYFSPMGREVVPLEDVERIRADLFVAILELEELPARGGSR